MANEISVDIMDYLSDAKMREIVEEEFRYKIRRSLADPKRLEDIITNVAFRCVWQAVDEATGKDAKAAIERKIPDVIAMLSEYYVFRSKDNGRDSVAQEMLEDVVRECRPILRDRIAEIFAGFDKEDLSYRSYRLRDVVDEAIEEWLRQKEADE
jgi:hypothetical protein